MNDTSAFEAFVFKHQDRVFGIAVRLLETKRGRGCVPDRFPEGVRTFRTVGEQPFGRRLAANRDHEPVPESSVPLSGSLAPVQPAIARWTGTGRSYEERLVVPGSQSVDLERAGEHARLEQGIRGLPPHQRVPLVLFHFEDKSYREIAGILGVTLAKVKTDIHRGRQALRRLMEMNDERR